MLTIRLKGGKGSGNFAHAGRPGEVGGSTSESSMPIPSQAKPYADERAAVGSGWDKLNGILQGWAVAEDSGDSNVEILRSASTRAFGGQLNDSENARYERIVERYRLDTSELEDSVRREYEFTQSKLKNDYPDGHVDLYRALHNVYDESDYPLEGKVSITEKSLSSWSSSLEGANKAIEYWGKNMGYRLLKTRIPIKDIFVYPGSSFAMRTQHEGEFVVIGRGNSIDVDIVDSVAYQSKEIEEKQLPISETSKLNLIKIRTNMFADEVNALAERMFTGNVTLGSWEETMKKMVRELHTSTAAIGKGGWDQMTPADWGRLGPVLKSQYKYLHNFAQYVEENKDTVSLKAIQARARMYGNAGAFSSVIVQAGDVLAKKLPWLPKDGSTECLVNCKCYWKLDVIETEGDWVMVQCVWHLRPAEHCKTCVSRNNHVVLVKVHKTVPIPSVIG